MNAGSVTANGLLTIDLTSPDRQPGTSPGKGEVVATARAQIHLGAGKSETAEVESTRVRPAYPAEPGFLSATIDPANVFKNPDQNDRHRHQLLGISITAISGRR